MPPSDFGQFETHLARLAAKFGQEFKTVTGPGYPEARLRDDYLNPLFRALGWDLENAAALIQSRREVEIESRTDIAGRAKRADYLFRTDARDRFVCEAKKPRSPLGPRDAFQAKRYAFNMGLPLAILSDFEEIKVYVVGGRPHLDRPDEGLWKTWNFRQYPLLAQEIWDLLARENIAAGSIDTLLDTLPKRAPAARGGKARQAYLIKPDRTRALDADFLTFLDEARHDLASSIRRHNPGSDLLAGDGLNAATQHILDRLLFIRICEDRDIDTGRRLDSIVDIWRNQFNRPGSLPARQASFLPDPASDAAAARVLPADSLWSSVVAHFRALDHRPPGTIPFFNGQLFKHHFSEDLLVGDKWLAGFIARLSDDESPYLFNIIPVEILGSVYERFLGKVIRPHGTGVQTVEKPEVRKAGGVYYTPRYIVNYIVEQTVGRIVGEISAAAPKFAAVEKRSRAVRILDPACGSGSFLIRAFERMCEHWLAWLTAHPEDQKKKECWVDEKTGDVHLTVDLKRRILRDNIFGVDLDPQAVEVTQLSLYLKMLEGETRQTLARERELFGEAIALLPPLDANIKCGNSLIASDFSLVAEDLIRVRAFDWPVQFREIMKAGGFDAVIGNPPWGAELDRQTLKYLSEKFSRVVQRMIDTYIYFTDQGLQLIQQGGKVGFVVPSTVLNQVDTRPLRRLLIEAGLSAVVNLGKDIFTKRVLNTTTLIATAGGQQPDQIYVADYSRVPLEDREDALKTITSIDAATWLDGVKGDSNATFFANSDASTALLLRLRTTLRTLGEYTLHGIARGVSPDIAEPHVVSDEDLELANLEPEILRRSLSGKQVKRYLPAVPDQRLIYTQRGMNQKKFPNALARLGAFRHKNTCSEVKEGKHPWWALHRARDPDIFLAPKLIGLTTTKKIEIVLDEDQNLVVTDAMYVFRFRAKISMKAALGVLHSKLFTFLYRVSNQGESRVIPQIKAAKLEPLPFPDLTTRHDRLVALVDKMLALTPKLRAEPNDAKRAILENAIAATDHQIDALVYQLYALSPEEIALVEAAPAS